MDPELWELLEERDSEDEIAAIVRLGQAGTVPKGVRVVAELGDIATLRMKLEDIQEVRAEESVTSLKAPEPAGFGLAPDLELDPIEAAEGLSQAEPWIYERRPRSLPETGRGVVIGVVDWGFDFAHADFRHEDGHTWRCGTSARRLLPDHPNLTAMASSIPRKTSTTPWPPKTPMRPSATILPMPT